MLNKLLKYKTHILVFCMVALADILWTYYIQSVGAHATMKASIASSVIVMLSAWTTINYVKDTKVIISGMLGAFVGTYITMKFGHLL